MDSEIIKRYNKEPNGPYIIDILIDQPLDLFTELDGVISWKRKDLDEDVDHYVMECIEELGNLEWMLRLNLRTEPDEAMERKLVYAIRSFYRYKQRDIRKGFNARLVKTALSFVLGLGILSAITFGGGLFAGHLGEIAREGLMVAVWVAIWNAVQDLLYEAWPAIKRQRRSKAAADACITFRYLIE